MIAPRAWLPLLVWPAVFLPCFALLAAVLGSSSERREHFWRRAVLLASGPAVLPMVFAVVPGATFKGLGPWLAFGSALTLMIGPALLYRSRPADPEDGGGPGPEPPSAPPDPPGGIPLPDAEQSRTRLRDHGTARRLRLRHRRHRVGRVGKVRS